MSDISVIEAQLAAAKTEYERIQEIVEPLKAEREQHAVAAQEANARAIAINDRIEEIYAENNFKAVARRYGILANTRMELLKA